MSLEKTLKLIEKANEKVLINFLRDTRNSSDVIEVFFREFE